jgi:hypothetical protein
MKGEGGGRGMTYGKRDISGVGERVDVVGVI